jgi:hypothetical protein
VSRIAIALAILVGSSAMACLQPAASNVDADWEAALKQAERTYPMAPRLAVIGSAKKLQRAINTQHCSETIYGIFVTRLMMATPSLSGQLIPTTPRTGPRRAIPLS